MVASAAALANHDSGLLWLQLVEDPVNVASNELRAICHVIDGSEPDTECACDRRVRLLLASCDVAEGVQVARSQPFDLPRADGGALIAAV